MIKGIRRSIRSKNTKEKIVHVLEGGKIRITQCHTFGWSRSLWKKAADRIRIETTIMLLIYLGIFGLCCHYDGTRGVDIPYFIVTTITTIGLGDISMSKQHQWFRLVSIFLLPFGIIILSFGIAHIESLLRSDERLIPKLDVLVDKAAFIRNNLESTRESLKMQSRAALTLRVKFDRAWNDFVESPHGKTIMALRNFFFVVFLGAIFFRFFHHEQILQERNADTDMNWTDCFYFATVVCTTVGYGHIITPQSNGAKIFCIFYFLLGTTVAGSSINELSEVFFVFKQDEIYAKIIDSTVWVHKADLHRTGFICQSDYGETGICV